MFKNDKVFILECSCGCGNIIRFTEASEYVFVDFLSPMFYSEQRSFFSVFKRRNSCLFEVITTEADLRELRNFLDGCHVSGDSDMPASLVLCEDNDDLSVVYSVRLEGRRHFRSFELLLGQRDVSALIHAVDDLFPPC